MSTEKVYIELCKCKIEKLLVSNIDNSGIKSRDLIYLSKIIQEKSGVLLSLSTLKRLWGKSTNSIPQPATLDALVSILNYKDWQDFKQQNPTHSKDKPKRTSYKKAFLIIATIIISILLVWLIRNYINVDKAIPVVYNDVFFSADKTIATGVPNTVIFKYNVSNVSADSFFIQQSWNDRNKVGIEAQDSILSSIYYKPGFHRAKLIANNTVIAKQNVHILSNGWIPYINYDVRDIIPQYIDYQSQLSNGYFSVKSKALEETGFDLTKNFKLRLNNSCDFGVSDDNFSFNSIIKCDRINSVACPIMNVMLVFEAHVFWIKLVKKGCEHNASYKIGEVVANGSNNDLSALGCNVFEWQNLEIIAHNKQVQVLLNGQSAIQTSYTQDFGKLMGIIFTFDGLGSVDFVSISGADGNLVYKDDMN